MSYGHAALPCPLRGIVPPLVTPLLPGDRLDVASLERLIEHLIGGGVHGLFLLGTTGEGPSLGYRLRYEQVERACELVAGRLPVLVSVSDTAQAESLELAAHARDCGAAAVVATAPYYYTLTQPQLVRHFVRLAEQSPLPLFLYNIPSCVPVEIAPNSVLECSRIPNIVGLKDSSGDLDYFARVHRLVSAARPDFGLLVGPEELLAEAVTLGAHGGVHGGANLFPALYVALWEAAIDGAHSRCAELQAIVMQVSQGLYHLAEGPTRVLLGIKAGLAALGICSPTVVEPMAPLGQAQLDAAARCVRLVAALLAAARLEPANARIPPAHVAPARSTVAPMADPS